MCAVDSSVSHGFLMKWEGEKDLLLRSSASVMVGKKHEDMEGVKDEVGGCRLRRRIGRQGGCLSFLIGVAGSCMLLVSSIYFLLLARGNGCGVGRI